jgi:hypothetical protein
MTAFPGTPEKIDDCADTDVHAFPGARLHVWLRLDARVERGAAG